MLGRSSGNHDWLLANASACVSCGFRLYATHATHATQSVAFEWKPGLLLLMNVCGGMRLWQVYRTNLVRQLSSGTWRATQTICMNVSPVTEYHLRLCDTTASPSNVSLHRVFPDRPIGVLMQRYYYHEIVHRVHKNNTKIKKLKKRKKESKCPNTMASYSTHKQPRDREFDSRSWRAVEKQPLFAFLCLSRQAV